MKNGFAVGDFVTAINGFFLLMDDYGECFGFSGLGFTEYLRSFTVCIFYTV
ncbi:hypothetical protein [Ketobacter sp.]